MWSYWEKTTFLEYDYVVVGGGLVGMSTALSIREREPRARILIIDSGWLPQGASTRNAGFACFGSLSEIVADLRTHTEAEVIELILLRWKGLQMLRKRLGDEKIEYTPCGSHELIWEASLPVLEDLNRINNMLHPILGEKVFSEDAHAVKKFGFSKEIKTCVYNRLEGGLHTGKMIEGLARLCGREGIDIRNGGTLENWEENQNGVKVIVRCGNDTFPLRTGKLLLCTNAFTKKLFPDLDIQPGRGQILITQPIPGLSVKGIFHFEDGYYYFRNIGDRVLFGGGRNLDFSAEETLDFGTTDAVQDQLKHYLKSVILPQTSFDIDYSWSGIMAFGSKRGPIIQPVSRHVWMGVRMGGMGVAIGSAVGNQLAEKITQHSH